ncbi:MAG: hypothetical protein A2X49_16765 [Lentisphaerae bacterium GWF2_52_8]|nr:MAG: hypothetical protein A2X49_16765 [Lentisphaerae bacterium GWF2_52_8]
MDASEGAAGDDLLDLAVVGAITVLVADDGLDVGPVERALDLHCFGAGQGDRLLEGDQLCPAFDASLDEGHAEVGVRAEAEDIGLDLFAEFGCIGSDGWIAELGSGGLKARLVDVADAHDFKTAIGIEGCGVVHAALAHADYHDFVLGH